MNRNWLIEDGLLLSLFMLGFLIFAAYEIFFDPIPPHRVSHPCDCGQICNKQFKCNLKECPNGL